MLKISETTDPDTLQLWLDGYLLAVEVIKDSLAELQLKGAPLTWALVKEVVFQAGIKGRAGLDPTDPNNRTAH